MKLLFFHLLAFATVAVLTEELEKPSEPNAWEKGMLWLDDRLTPLINPGAAAKAGDECSVSTLGLLPDPAHLFTSYSGQFQTAASCYDGLAVFGTTFHADANARARSYEYLKDELACCLRQIKCGPGYKGNCVTRGNGCTGLFAKPLASSDCPGVATDCCPPDEQQSSADSSTGYETNIFALGGDTSLGAGDVEQLALGVNLPPITDPNPQTLEAEPPLIGQEGTGLDNNLYLATDDFDDQALIASFGSPLEGGYEFTG